MSQEKKQKLSSKFRKAVLRKSASEVWEEAVLEWEFDKYYYNDTKVRIYCPCSPREIKHITVMKNKITNELLEIDNNCAETYFGITESETIKKMVQKLSRDINLGMNKTALDYLWKNRCIHEIDYNNYEIAQGKRESKHPYSENMIRIRQEINTVLINYTKYRYKDFFAWIDYAIATSDERPDFDVSSAMSIRQDVLVSGELDNYKLNGLRDTTEKNYKYYSEEKRNKIMDEHLKKGLNDDLKERLAFSEFHNKITHLTPLTGEALKLWEQNKAKIAQMEKKHQTNKDDKKVDYSYLAEGLEDGTEVWSYNVDVNNEHFFTGSENRGGLICSTEEWEEWKKIYKALSSSNVFVLRSFYASLYRWITLLMEVQGIRPALSPFRHALPDVIDFIDIPEITHAYRNGSFSFDTIMSSMSIETLYQLLDFLRKTSDDEVREYILELFKKILYD